MIEIHCRAGNHEKCPEIARQADPTLNPVQKIGGSLCDCAHVVLTSPTEHDTDRIDC